MPRDRVVVAQRREGRWCLQGYAKKNERSGGNIFGSHEDFVQRVRVKFRLYLGEGRHRAVKEMIVDLA